MVYEMLGPVLNGRGLRYRRNILLVATLLNLIGLAEGIDVSGFEPFGLAGLVVTGLCGLVLFGVRYTPW